MKNIIEIIEKINRRPGMFIITESITELQGFLTGYMMHGYYKGEYDKTESELLKKFGEWLKENHIPYLQDTNYGWYSSIKLIYPNEHEAFRAFLKLWNEFIEVSCPQYG